MQNNREKGTQGEDLAKEYLLNQGYQILTTNFYTKKGEIDIIAKDKEYIVFIEVKYRNSTKFGYPREAVGNTKKKKILTVANIYINNNNIKNSDFRFDVIEILKTNDQTDIEHIKNAF